MNIFRPENTKASANALARHEQQTIRAQTTGPTSHAFLQNILESLPYQILVFDVDERLLFVNQAYQTLILHMYGQHAKVGMTLSELFADLTQDLQKAQIVHQRAMQGETSTIIDRFSFEDREMTFEITYGPFFNEEHICIGSMVLFKEKQDDTQAEISLPSLQAILEQRVSERTAILEEKNQALKHEIAERSRLEEAAHRNEQHFRLLADMVPQMVWVVDQEGHLVYANHKSRGFFNISSPTEQVDWQDIIHPDDWSIVISLGQRINDPELYFTGEIRMRRNSSDSYRWQMIHATLLHDAENTQWIVSVTDIDDLKRIQEHLQQNEQRLHWLMNTMPHLVWETSADATQIEYGNQRWLEYCGLHTIKDYMPGNKDFVHPDDWPSVYTQWSLALSRGESYEVEIRIRSARDGTYRWHLVRNQPIKDSKGEVIRWLGTATDIHNSKLIEKSLRESEQNFRLLADAMPQIVWTARPDGWINYYNQKWFEYTGMTSEQAGGWGWGPVIHPDDLPLVYEIWTTSLHTGNDYQVELRFKRASDGMYRWHLVRALPARDEQGKIIKWFGTNTDIHDSKVAQKQLSQLLQNEQMIRAEVEATNERLELMNKVQSDFISIVSHEFRTTLTGIQGFSELLCNEEFSPEEVKDYASDINSDSKRLTRMINDLLDLERMKSGKMTLQIETVDINHLLKEVAERCISTTNQHTIVQRLDPNLPTLQGDPDKLIQVLTNLTSNAIKYSPNGGEILLSSKKEKNKVHIQVQDSGIGIPENALEEVFAPYSRIDVQKTRYIKGTGLGLAIVRQIVEMHKGEVWVESTLGQGSTFHVRLPLKQASKKAEK